MSTCVRGDETCQWPLFGERLVDTVYIGQTFTNYVNFILFAYIVLVFYVSSSYFSIPFYLYEMRYGKERKENQKALLEKRKIRLAKRKEDRAARKKDPTEANKEVKKEEGREPQQVDIDVAKDVDKVEPEKFPQFKGVDTELEQADNKAFAICYSGYMLGLCILLTGPRTPSDPSDDPMQTILDQLLWGFLGIVLLTLNFLVQNKVLLYSLNNVVETLHGNLFVAIVETSCFIGTSFNIRAVLSGSPGRNMAETIGSTLLFYVLGQIIMIAFTFAFRNLLRTTTSWKQGENPTTGIKMGCNIITLSILTSSPLEKTEELSAFFIYIILSSLFLLAFSMLLDKYILPGNMNSEIENDQNWGLALVSGGVTISVAAILDTMLLDVPCPGTDAYDLMMQSLPTVDTSTKSCYKCTLGERLVSTDYMLTLFEPWNIAFGPNCYFYDLCKPSL